MTTEYFIALSIVVLLAILTVYLILSSDKDDDKIEYLNELVVEINAINCEQKMQIEALKRELAKKDSLVSILRAEIQEKEKK